MSGSNGWKYCPYCGNRLKEKYIKRGCSYAGTINPFDQGRIQPLVEINKSVEQPLIKPYEEANE